MYSIALYFSRGDAAAASDITQQVFLKLMTGIAQFRGELEHHSCLPTNLSGIDTSLRSLTGAIEWSNIKVEPDTSPALPIENGPSRYYAARATDAAPITVGEQHEKFLFYRGVARFPVPLSVQLERDGRVAVQNTGSEAVPVAILFENRGGHIGFRNMGAITDTATLNRPSLDGSMAVLRYDLETALTDQGLYPAEARAMLSTWQDSWFEEGSRLIYILSSHAVDGVLPLHVDPTPAETARVFVGRIELVTPEIESAVGQAIVKRDRPALERYGRFLDAILTRISAESDVKALQIQQFREGVLPYLGISGCKCARPAGFRTRARYGARPTWPSRNACAWGLARRPVPSCRWAAGRSCR